MAITGIDTIDGKQIIAAGAVSAKSAEMAYNDENGNPITGYLTAVPTGTMNESAFGYDGDNKISSYNGSAFAGGSAPTYDYTDNDLISAIDTSGLYATSADIANNANSLVSNGTMGNNITQSDGANNFLYMPTKSPWTTATVAKGIFSPLQYATGACLAMDGGNFAAYFKGNEWYVCNTGIGQMLRGEVHQSRGVHISGATTAGYGFNLGINVVSGVNSNGSWKYGHDEDVALRAVSSCDMHESAFEYDANDKISGYNGSAFAGGGEFPQSATEAIETVTANSADWNGTTETVSSNSGAWGGSALPISAGPGIKFEMVDNTLVASTDETVLWSGENSAFSLSEPATNFDRLLVVYNSTEAGTAIPTTMQFPATAQTLNLQANFIKVSNDFVINDIQKYTTTNYTDYSTTTAGVHVWYSMQMERLGGSNGMVIKVTKVIGINRK